MTFVYCVCCLSYRFKVVRYCFATRFRVIFSKMYLPDQNVSQCAWDPILSGGLDTALYHIPNLLIFPQHHFCSSFIPTFYYCFRSLQILLLFNINSLFLIILYFIIDCSTMLQICELYHYYYGFISVTNKWTRYNYMESSIFHFGRTGDPRENC